MSGTEPTFPFGARSNKIKALLEHAEPILGRPRLSLKELRTLVNVVCSASLKKEEEHYTAISICLTDSEVRTLAFSTSMPLTAEAIAKLSAGLNETSNCVAVRLTRSRALEIYGIALEPVIAGLMLRILKPCHVLVYAHYEPIAEIIEDQVLLLNPVSAQVDLNTHSAAMCRRWGGEDIFQLAWCLRALARAMRHGRGGTLLVVPHNSAKWRRSILGMGYEIRRKGANLLDFYRISNEWAERSRELHTKKEMDRYFEWSWDLPEQREFTKATETFGQLTAVDGATIVDTRLRIIAFGAKIATMGDVPKTIRTIDPANNTQRDGPLFGGMRHRSAAQFAHNNRDSIAIVASQAGPMTWFGVRDGLTALKCDTLLED